MESEEKHMQKAEDNGVSGGVSDSPRRARGWLRPAVLVAACSLITLATPAYWFFGRPPDFLGLEKRYRDEWPEWTADAALSGEYGKDVETWMADAMPLREFLVGVDSYVWYIGGRQAARNVVKTGDGALVEAPPDFNAAELDKRLDKIAAFAGALSETLDAKPVLLVPPNAGYAASDRVPWYVRGSYPDDKIAEAILSRSAPAPDTALDAAPDTAPGTAASTFSFVDLRKVFRDAGEPLFYHTDHHWNGGGAYAAYSALSDELGFAELPREAFTVSGRIGFYGSTYAKSGLWLNAPDMIDLWAPPCAVSVTIGEGDAAKTADSLFFTEHLEARDMYPVFLDGIYNIAVVENLSGRASAPEQFAGGTLLVVQDSYANSLIPLLIPHYDRIVAVDLRYYRNPVSELAELHAADAVLFVYSMDHIVNDPDILWLR